MEVVISHIFRMRAPAGSPIFKRIIFCCCFCLSLFSKFSAKLQLSGGHWEVVMKISDPFQAIARVVLSRLASRGQESARFVISCAAYDTESLFSHVISSTKLL